MENKVVIVGRGQSKGWDEIMRKELEGAFNRNGEEFDEKTVKFIDAEGNETIPMESELLNAIVGYNHIPDTHNYNRAERRRIIKAAKKLEKKYGKK